MPELRTSRSLLVCAACAVTVAAAPALAAMNFSSQFRHVEVSALGSPQALADASDFSLFNRTVQWTDPLEGHGGVAAQRSELLGDRIVVSSTLSAADGRSGFTAAASSTFDVAFNLDQPANATLSGSWIMDTQLTGVSLTGQMRLTRDGAPVWTVPISAAEPTGGAIPFTFNGELGSGAYRLEASASLLAALIPGFTSGTGGLAATLVVNIPVPDCGLAFGCFLVGGGAIRRRSRRPG